MARTTSSTRTPAPAAGERSMTSWTRTPGSKERLSSDPESFSRTSSPRKAVPLLGGEGPAQGLGERIRDRAVGRGLAGDRREREADPRAIARARRPVRAGRREIIGPIVGGGGGRFQGERSPARILHLPGAPGSADPIEGPARPPGTAQIGRRRTARQARATDRSQAAGDRTSPMLWTASGWPASDIPRAKLAISLIPEPSAKVGAWEANTNQRTPPRSSLNTSQRRIVAREPARARTSRATPRRPGARSRAPRSSR